MLQIIGYESAHQPWFEKLNREWIERHFWMEPLDVEVLQHPDKHIIEQGGAILMARLDDEIAGTVALKWVAPGVYEFTKMAVDERFRGRKIGQRLADSALHKARTLGAKKVILYSSTKLVPALALYRKLGFVDVPVDGPYKRSDIKMELNMSSIMGNISIRTASPSDGPMLTELGSRTFYETFMPFNSKSDMQLYLEKNFTEAVVANEFREPGTTFLVAEAGETIVGYAKIRTLVRPDELDATHPIEIERIYSIKEYLGKGVGKQLMEACLNLAKQNSHDVVWLGVWENNPRAISFYQKYGFRKFATHPFMLGNDLQTDWLMKKPIT